MHLDHQDRRAGTPLVRYWLGPAVDRWTSVCYPENATPTKTSGFFGDVEGVLVVLLHALRVAAHLIGLALLCVAFALSALFDLATYRLRHRT